MGTSGKVKPDQSLFKKRSSWIERHIFQLSRVDQIASEKAQELEKSREHTIFRGNSGSKEGGIVGESQKVLLSILKKEGGKDSVEAFSNKKILSFLDYLLTVQIKNLVESAIRSRDGNGSLKNLSSPLTMEEYKSHGEQLLAILSRILKTSFIKKRNKSLESSAFILFCSDWEEFLPELTHQMPEIFEGMPSSRLSQKNNEALDVQPGEEIEKISLQIRLLDSPKLFWVKMGSKLRLFWFDRCLLFSFFKSLVPFNESQKGKIEAILNEAKYTMEMFPFLRGLFLENLSDLVGVSKTQLAVWFQSWFRMFLRMNLDPKEEKHQTRPAVKIETFIK